MCEAKRHDRRVYLSLFRKISMLMKDPKIHPQQQSRHNLSNPMFVLYGAVDYGMCRGVELTSAL